MRHQPAKIHLKQEPVYNRHIVIGSNVYTAVVKEFIPCSPEELRARYIKEAIWIAASDYEEDSDQKPIDLTEVMKAGDLTKADIISGLTLIAPGSKRLSIA